MGYSFVKEKLLSLHTEPVCKPHHPNPLEVVTAPLFQSSRSSSTGSRFFSLALPGYSACLFDYLASMSKIPKCVASGDIVTVKAHEKADTVTFTFDSPHQKEVY